MSYPDPILAAASPAHTRVAGLIEQEWTALQRIATRLALRIGVRSHVDDVMQESAAAALRAAHQFRFGDRPGFRRWWTKIAHGIAVRFARSPSSFFEIKSSDPDAFDPRSSTPSPRPPKEKPPRREISLIDAIWNLEDTYREVILIRNYLGLDWETIALVLDKPSAAAARQHHVRGLAVLKRELLAWMSEHPPN